MRELLAFFRKDTENDLLADKVLPLLVRIAVPASVGMFFQILYVLVDTFWAGQMGSDTVTVVTLGFPFFLILQALPIGITAASNVLQANALGRKQLTEADKIFKQAILFSLSFSLLACMIVFLIAPPIIHFVYEAIPLSIRQRAISYLYIRFSIGTIFAGALAVLNSALAARGNTRTMRNLAIVAFTVNFFLAPLLSVGLFWQNLQILPGYAEIGLGWSYVLVQGLNALLLIVVLNKKKLITRQNLRYYFLPQWSVFRMLILQGIPATLNSLNIAINFFIINYFVAKFGSEATAGYGSAIRIEQLFLIPSIGVSTAAMAIISQNFGARLFSRVREVFRSAYMIALLMYILCVVVLVFFSPVLLFMIVDDAVVVNYGSQYLRIAAIGCFMSYLTFAICFATLQGIKKPLFFIFISFYRLLLVNIPTYYLMTQVLQLGTNGLWVGLILVQGSAALILLWKTRYHLNRLEIYAAQIEQSTKQSSLSQKENLLTAVKNPTK